MSDNISARNFERVSSTLQPEAATRFMQNSTLRLMRANERILHGFMAAVTQEMQLAQDLMQFNFQKFSTIPNGAMPTSESAAEGRVELEHIVAGMREVSAGLWKTFGEASKLLVEGSLTEAKEAVRETASGLGEIQSDAVAATSAASHRAGEAASSLVDKSVELPNDVAAFGEEWVEEPSPSDHQP